ncbi:MAG: glycosyltransferase family 117 protein, partial [Anaerolineae bacterium]
GVPHPSGYPTYLMLGSLFVHLPLGDLAWRFNLMSAVGAACATGFTVLAVAVSLQRMSQGEGHVPWVAGVAGMTFAFSSLLWSQAVVAEVYSWNACFAAWIWYLMLRARASGKVWLWALAAYVFGLGLGNHLSLLALAPAGLVLFLSPSEKVGQDTDTRSFCALRRAAVAVVALLALAAGAAVYGVLPLRATHKAPVNWGGADTWEGFVWLVTGQAYAPLVAALPIAHLPGRLLAALALLVRQTAWWGVPAAYLGVQALWRHDRPIVIATSLSSLVLLVYAVGYNTSDSYVYLIPLGMMLALWIAWGLAEGWRYLLPQVGAPLGQLVPTQLMRWGIWVLALVPLMANYQMVDASRDWRAHNFGVGVLDSVEQGAMIITETAMDTFPLWYFHYAEGRRSDIILINGNLLAYKWYRDSVRHRYPSIELPDTNDHPVQVVQKLVYVGLARGAVYLTTPHWSLPDSLRLMPAGALYRVEREGGS